MARTPIPVSCTLTPEQGVQRLADWHALRDEALVGSSRSGLVATMRFRAGAGDRVRELVAAECECCSFLSFAVRVDGDEVVVDVSGPPGAAPVLEVLVGR